MRNRQEAKPLVCASLFSDNGIGIGKEFYPSCSNRSQEMIYMMTMMAAQVLGLSIAYNLITSMDGDVFVKKSEGKGNTFIIRVILESYDDGKHKEEAYALPTPTDYKLSGVNVLIAEDNALNRTILEAMLTSEGVTFTEAVDGEMAVKIFNESPEYTFSCILMDMRMPKLDGIRTTEAIRSSGKPDSESIPIIGVSANGFADDIRKARIAGINDYVTKPLDRDTLLASMSKLISST